jgi:hypothetical protein
MTVNGWSSVVVVLGLLLGVAGAGSQERGVTEIPEGEQDSRGGGDFLVAGLVTVLGPVLFPKFIGDAWRLKEFIRSEEFSGVRADAGDPGAVDAIFSRARELSWGNIYEALFISAVATFDHRRVGVDLPLLGPLLWFPLTSEFEDDFQSRIQALPTRLYADTPHLPAGDRDKLQHFFGSAFLAAVSESRDAAERVGDFVEWGEERFIVGGVSEERDVRANRQGQAFGLRLMVDGRATPSQFLRCEVAEQRSIDAAPCAKGGVPRRIGVETEER